jgi:hypothetical protein
MGRPVSAAMTRPTIDPVGAGASWFGWAEVSRAGV